MHMLTEIPAIGSGGCTESHTEQSSLPIKSQISDWQAQRQCSNLRSVPMLLCLRIRDVVKRVNCTCNDGKLKSINALTSPYTVLC